MAAAAAAQNGNDHSRGTGRSAAAAAVDRLTLNTEHPTFHLPSSATAAALPRTRSSVFASEVPIPNHRRVGDSGVGNWASPSLSVLIGWMGHRMGGNKGPFRDKAAAGQHLAEERNRYCARPATTNPKSQWGKSMHWNPSRAAPVRPNSRCRSMPGCTGRCFSRAGRGISR